MESHEHRFSLCNWKGNRKCGHRHRRVCGIVSEDMTKLFSMASNSSGERETCMSWGRAGVQCEKGVLLTPRLLVGNEGFPGEEVSP